MLQNWHGGFSESFSPMAKPWKISENLPRNLHTYFKRSGEIKFIQRWPKSPVTQKVQLACVFYLILQAYSTDFRSCTFSRGGFSKDCLKILSKLFEKPFPSFLMFLILAKKCNPCDHLICYNNLPLNMHEILDHTFGDWSDVLSCFIYHLICLYMRAVI